MSGSLRSAIMALAACGTLAAFTIGAEAQPFHHAAHHVAHHAKATREAQPSQYASTGFVEPERIYEGPSRRTWIGGERDDDSANAKNPALPWYARNRGGETGGPARMLINE